MWVCNGLSRSGSRVSVVVVNELGFYLWLRSDDRWWVHADGAGRGFGEVLSDDSRGKLAVNVASFSAGVTPLRAMEKRS